MVCNIYVFLIFYYFFFGGGKVTFDPLAAYVYLHRTKSAVYPHHQHAYTPKHQGFGKHVTSDITMNLHFEVTIEFWVISTEALVSFPEENLTNSKQRCRNVLLLLTLLFCPIIIRYALYGMHRHTIWSYDLVTWLCDMLFIPSGKGF